MLTIVKILKQIRLSKDSTQVELTDAILTQAEYSEVETKKSSINAEALLQMLTRLAISVDEFLFIQNGSTISAVEKRRREMLAANNSGDIRKIAKMIAEMRQDSSAPFALLDPVKIVLLFNTSEFLEESASQ